MHLRNNKRMIWSEELFTISPSLEMEGSASRGRPLASIIWAINVTDSPDGVDMHVAQC